MESRNFLSIEKSRLLKEFPVKLLLKQDVMEQQDVMANIVQPALPYRYLSDLSSIYNVPLLPIGKRVVGIISFSTGIGLCTLRPLETSTNKTSPFTYKPLIYEVTDSDTHKTWSNAGQNIHPTVLAVSLNGNSMLQDYTDSDTVENLLDIAAIGAMCQTSNLTIIIYIATNKTPYSDLFKPILNGISVKVNSTDITETKYIPTIVSISWGAQETLWPYSYTTALNNILADNPNLNVCASTGDYGSTSDDKGTGNLEVMFPASCPRITAVGGTTLYSPTKIYDVTETTTRTSEGVWNDGLNLNTSTIPSTLSFYATGGGISRTYSKPTYQSNTQQTNYRTLPDISMTAKNCNIVANNSLQYLRGTSISAPLFAGYLAAINVSTFVNPILYTAPQNCFHTISAGNNYSNIATYNNYSNDGTGTYNYCTGLGSIVGDKLALFIWASNYVFTKVAGTTTCLVSSPTSVTTGQMPVVPPTVMIDNIEHTVVGFADNSLSACSYTDFGVAVQMVTSQITTIGVNAFYNATSNTGSIFIEPFPAFTNLKTIGIGAFNKAQFTGEFPILTQLEKTDVSVFFSSTFNGPKITKTNPEGIAGNSCRLDCTGLLDTNYGTVIVKFDGVAVDRSSYYTYTNKHIAFIIPQGTGTASITVSAGGKTSNSVTFTYLPPCLLKNTKVLTADNTHVNIQDLKVGDYIRGAFSCLPKQIKSVAHNRLYYDTLNTNNIPCKIPKHYFVELQTPSEDVYISGGHSLLYKDCDTIKALWTSEIVSSCSRTDLVELGYIDDFGYISYYHIDIDEVDGMVVSGMPVETLDMFKELQPELLKTLDIKWERIHSVPH